MAKNGGKKLSHTRKKAVAALMSCNTVAAASEQCGVSHRTLTRWLSDDTDFRQGLAEAESAAVEAASRLIADGSRLAVSHFREVLSDPTIEPERKDRAASQLLMHLPKLRLLGSVESAIEELRRTVND